VFKRPQQGRRALAFPSGLGPLKIRCQCLLGNLHRLGEHRHRHPHHEGCRLVLPRVAGGGRLLEVPAFRPVRPSRFAVTLLFRRPVHCCLLSRAQSNARDRRGCRRCRLRQARSCGRSGRHLRRGRWLGANERGHRRCRLPTTGAGDGGGAPPPCSQALGVVRA